MSLLLPTVVTTRQVGLLVREPPSGVIPKVAASTARRLETSRASPPQDSDGQTPPRPVRQPFAISLAGHGDLASSRSVPEWRLEWPETGHGDRARPARTCPLARHVPTRVDGERDRADLAVLRWC